jgi:hypothetical protein
VAGLHHRQFTSHKKAFTGHRQTTSTLCEPVRGASVACESNCINSLSAVLRSDNSRVVRIAAANRYTIVTQVHISAPAHCWSSLAEITECFGVGHFLVRHGLVWDISAPVRRSQFGTADDDNRAQPLIADQREKRIVGDCATLCASVAARAMARFAVSSVYDFAVRLQNVIERSVIVCETANFSVDESWLSQQPLEKKARSQLYLSEKVATQEKEMIEAALRESQGRVFGPSGAAEKLGIARSTLESKIRSLKIDKSLQGLAGRHSVRRRRTRVRPFVKFFQPSELSGYRAALDFANYQKVGRCVAD